jgi:F-box protein 18 (helicase)
MATEVTGRFTAHVAEPLRNHPARTLTEEQKAICSVSLEPGQVMLIEAFAGAAKTSTLEEYAFAHKHLSFLYMAFNTSAAEDARRRFPQAVTCKTQHALAFADCGRPYKEKLDNLRPKTIMRPMGFDFSSQAQIAIDTINNFLHSPDTALSLKHLPSFVHGDPDVKATERSRILEAVNKLWARMCDPQDREVPMPHDGYLKLWQLEIARTGRLPAVFNRFEVLFLDEAQDTNPTMEAVMRAAVKAGKHRIVLVGDSRQNIYGFRGAVNLMERIGSDIATGKINGITKSLTCSFRYPQEIADVATAILNADLSPTERGVKVRGMRPSTDKHCLSEAVISRSNGGLIGAAIDYLQHRPGAKIHFVATSQRTNWDPTLMYRFDSLLGVWFHKNGMSRSIKDPYIRSFSSYAEIVEFAKGDKKGQGADRELEAYVRLVEFYGRELPGHLDKIIRHCGSPEGARCFGTAHRSKGLEWDRVTLTDDFEKSCDLLALANPKAHNRPSREELNLLYVAVTRPRKDLVPHCGLIEFMEQQEGVASDICDETEEGRVTAGLRR